MPISEEVIKKLNKIQDMLMVLYEDWPLRCSLSPKEVKTIYNLIEEIKDESSPRSTI
jgi:hypothetical protein